MILRVTVNFEEFLLEIKEGSKSELIDWIDAILEAGTLSASSKGSSCSDPASSGVR